MATRLSFQEELHQRRFLFSAVSSELEKSLQLKVESLHGKVIFPARNTFSSLCTHVIAREFSPTEKVLGALAGGKWLLPIKYIEDSYKKGYWLSEEEYEYTNFNKVAAYHRRKTELRKCGLYYGWKILVVLDSPTPSRTFKRILAAGGAEVASKENVAGVDFVITTKELVKYAQAIVDSLIPLVDVAYIKDTLIFRNDPADLKKCDLRDQRKFEAIHKSPVSITSTSKGTCNIQGNHVSCKRPMSETPLSKRRQTCSKPKQTTLTQFLKPLVNRPSPNKKPSEARRNVFKNKSLSFSNSVVSSSRYNTLSGVPVVYDVEDEPQITDVCEGQQTETESSENIIPMPPMAFHSQLMECYVNLGNKIDEHCRFISEKFSEDSVKTENFSRRWIVGQSKQFKRDFVTLNQLPRQQSLKNDCSPEQIDREVVLSKHLARRQSLQCNTAFSEEVQKEALPSKLPSFTITRPHARKAIVNFIRTRKYISEVCCTSILSIPVGSEYYSKIENKSCNKGIDPQEILDTPRIQHFAGEHRELTAREINLYTCFVTPELHDQELQVHGLDTLLIQLSTYLYPPPAILGSLLKDLILETPFHTVHSRALRVAFRVLSLHPPSTTKMQEYYRSVLQTAMKTGTFGNYSAWKFIQSVIHCASNKNGDKEILQSQNTEKEECCDKATRALNLLEFFTILITEDVKNSEYGNTVQELLTWDIFWGPSRTCSVLPPPVKQLLHLWLSQHTASPPLRWHLSHLVSVLLEVMWKFSGHPLVPVTVLPYTLAAVKMEIGIHVQGLSSQQSLEVIRNLHNPWAQSVVSFIILQEIAQCPEEMTLPRIVDLFSSASKHSSSSAVIRPESAKKVHNNLPLNVRESPKASRRSTLPHINERNSRGSSSPRLNICAADFKDRKTTLHDAVIMNRLDSVKHLLDNGGEDLLKAKTTDGKSAFDLASTKEMLRLLKTYKNKSVDCKIRSISPTMEDQMYHKELCLILANSYLEVSGNRYIFSTIKKCISRVVKENMKEKELQKMNGSHESDVNYECQTADEKMKKEITKRNTPQYLSLTENESLEGLSEVEEKAVVQIYNCIKLDKEVHKNRSLHSVAPVKKIDAKHFFKTLCL